MRKIRSLRERFNEKVDRSESSGPCWEWTAFRDKNGYGRIGLGGREDGVGFAHRVAWMLFRGEIPAGKLVLHKCDNPPCVRPSHLFTGTDSDNAFDRSKKGRNRDQFGQKNNLSKIEKEEHIREIRRRVAMGESQVSIGKIFGVSQSAVSKIVRRKRWGHVK